MAETGAGSSSEKPALLPKQPGDITAGMASRLIGCCRSQVILLVLRGELGPSVERLDGRKYFNRSAIEAFATTYVKRRPGRTRKPLSARMKRRGGLFAKAFEMIDQGKNHREIVIALKLDPETMLEVFEAYQTTPAQQLARRKNEQIEREAKKDRELDWKDRRHKRWTQTIENVNLIRQGKAPRTSSY